MRKVWLSAALVAALLLDGAILTGALGTARLGVDFEVFWSASRRALPALYPGEPIQPFVNPPTSLILFAPFGALPYGPALLLWTGINLFVFYAGLRRFFPVFAVGGAMISPIFVWAVYLGQATPLLAGVLAFGLAAPPTLGGFLLALVLLVKPQMAWLLPLALFFSGDGRRLASTLATGTLAFVGSLLLAGIQPWRDWIGSMPQFRQALFDQQVILERTVSLSAQAQPLGPIAAMLAMAGALALAFYAIRRTARDSLPATLLIVAVGASAFAAPYALPHDVVALLPMAVASIASDQPLRRALATLFALGGLLPVLLAAYLGEQARFGASDLTRDFAKQPV